MEIVVNIKNSFNIKKLVRKIKIYKIIHRKKILKLEYSKSLPDNIKYELETIEKAFNKNKRKRLEYVYDRAYDFIVGNYVDTNFCEFKNNQCIVQRNKKSTKTNGCCGHCQHLKDKKCSINALSCKFYFCSYIQKNKKPIKINHINSINCYFTYRQKIIAANNVFQSKEKTLKDLYRNSILLWSFKGAFKTPGLYKKEIHNKPKKNKQNK